MKNCKTSLILIVYTRPYETARLYSEAEKTCSHTSIEERLGRILCELDNPNPDSIARLIKGSTGWSGEVRLRCPSGKCIKAKCNPHGFCLYNGRLIQVTHSRKGCTVRVGPKSSKLPEPPVPPTLFYTTRIEDLLDRIRLLESINYKAVRAS
ncbi:MAG: hypothetical protein GSR82_01215 [Desulfurococcales archaeon]|nr:hypothetical protein [Desulfurococcales archaeon]